jgi:(p)ppGpp synthase/HD superfamily hydrolase
MSNNQPSAGAVKLAMSQPQPETRDALQHEIEMAMAFCEQVHHGQFRRDGVTPYHTHPFAVADKVRDELKPAAYLHDVLEDTRTNARELRLVFSPRTCDAVEYLTRMSDETYNAYISRVLLNPDAVVIKIADMEHNFSCQPSDRSKEKIAMWLPILKDKAKQNLESEVMQTDTTSR